MPRLIIADPAVEEFRSASADLGVLSEAAAIKLHSRVLHRLDDLARHPEFGRLRPEYSRWLPDVRSSAVDALVKFSHRPCPDTVEVVRIIDGRQDLPALLGLAPQDEDQDGN